MSYWQGTRFGGDEAVLRVKQGVCGDSERGLVPELHDTPYMMVRNAVQEAACERGSACDRDRDSKTMVMICSSVIQCA